MRVEAERLAREREHRGYDRTHPKSLETIRLPNSISACVLSGRSGPPPHLPVGAAEPLSRSGEPRRRSTISVKAASVA